MLAASTGLALLAFAMSCGQSMVSGCSRGVGVSVMPNVIEALPNDPPTPLALFVICQPARARRKRLDQASGQTPIDSIRIKQWSLFKCGRDTPACVMRFPASARSRVRNQTPFRLPPSVKNFLCTLANSAWLCKTSRAKARSQSFYRASVSRVR